MLLPQLSCPTLTRQTIHRFGGYDHREVIEEGTFYDMENLSAGRYPLLSPRPPRREVVVSPTFVGEHIIAKNRLWYQHGNQLHGFHPNSKNTWIIDNAQLGNRTQLVSFGSYLIDMGECRWFSTLPDEQGDFDSGSFGYEWQGTARGFSAYICQEDGEPIEGITVGSVPPENPSDRDYWLDTGSNPSVLYQYFLFNAGWFPTHYYVRVSAPMGELAAQAGDRVEITFPRATRSDGTEITVHSSVDTAVEVMAVGQNPNGNPYLILDCQMVGTTGFAVADDGAVTVEEASPHTSTLTEDVFSVVNPIPLMDFVVEGGNRLWGCRYGTDRDGNFVNEIYASALGSFRVWQKFEGTAEDSYRVSCGTDGPFTGAICYRGDLLFFKENWLHKVYGDYPFQVTPMACQGVKEGSHASLCVVGNVLYYHGNRGICTYEGTLPRLLSLPFGEEIYRNARGAATATTYYLAVEQDDAFSMFVYDVVHKTLHKENADGIDQLCSFGGQVYALVSVMRYGMLCRGIICLTDQTVGSAPLESAVSWWAQSGKLTLSLPDHKYVVRLDLRLQLADDARLAVLVRYDNGEWESLYDLKGPITDSCTIPIRVRRCDTVALKLVGQGEAMIYSLTKWIQREE